MAADKTWPKCPNSPPMTKSQFQQFFRDENARPLNFKLPTTTARADWIAAQLLPPTSAALIHFAGFRLAIDPEEFSA